MKIALKIDVDTYRGTLEGVPALVALLQKYQAGATFLFSLGPDHTGRAIKRVFRPGFFSKVSRTSVVEHYGVKTLLYGTLLPGPDIGRKCAPIMRDVTKAGFETGIHTWDHVKWQDSIGTGADPAKPDNASNEWTEREMRAACTRYEEIFGVPARTHGAAGWQMNRHALRLTQRLEFDYCSDTRGSQPFIPVVCGEVLACPQIPSTLPTLDELIGLDGLAPDNVHEHVLKLSQSAASAHGHVYTLHAELEGMKLLPVFERLLQGWRARGDELLATRDIAAVLDRAALPHHNIVWAEVPGRSGVLATQGPEFLPLVQQAA
ncbi:MAG: 4-deoxy-4-formamido-L-arabinose-phosphoundecaprenol deformylase [Betaproteobacteria bacterium]|nr:4-deoxy-4-formamido-L-arabinose-phosphoundecaprenol deformylase [Betaproteobacteria bacterium]